MSYVKTSNQFRGMLVDVMSGLKDGDANLDDVRAITGAARQVNNSVSNDLRRIKLESETGIKVADQEIR